MFILTTSVSLQAVLSPLQWNSKPHHPVHRNHASKYLQPEAAGQSLCFMTLLGYLLYVSVQNGHLGLLLYNHLVLALWLVHGSLLLFCALNVGVPRVHFLHIFVLP